MSSKIRVLVVTGHPQSGQATASAIAEQLGAAGFVVTQAAESNVIRRLDDGAWACVVLAPTCQVTENDVLSLEDHVRGGGGLVAIGAPGSTSGHFHLLGGLLGCRVHQHTQPMDLRVQIADASHPLAHRLGEFIVHDELSLIEKSLDSHVFLSAWYVGKAMPIAHTRREGKGLVVTLGLGRTAEAIANPAWRTLLRRAVRLASGQDGTQRQLRAAVIGYGATFNTGRLHADALRRMRAPVVAICDRDPKRTQAARLELGEEIRTFTDPERLLAEVECELIIICTPHDTHARLAERALASGRHVVIEKPFAVTLGEADALLAAAARAGRLATAFHHRRWDGDWLAIRQIVAAGTIGEVYHVESFFGGYGAPRPDWWRSDKQVSGGAFYDFGPHFVDQVLELVGRPVTSVAGDFHKRVWHQVSNEDHLDATLRFEGGATASIQISSIAAIPRSRFRILGTRGAIEQRTADPNEPIRVVAMRDGRALESLIPSLPTDGDGFYRNLVDHLLLDEALAVRPAAARDVVAVLHLAETSAGRGGAPVPVPPVVGS